MHLFANTFSANETRSDTVRSGFFIASDIGRYNAGTRRVYPTREIFVLKPDPFLIEIGGDNALLREPRGRFYAGNQRDVSPWIEIARSCDDFCFLGHEHQLFMFNGIHLASFDDGRDLVV